jgi:hypothetical protein
MAFAPEPLGLAYFTAVKFVGYTAAAFYLRRRLQQTRQAPSYVIGGVRTAIGLAAGIGALALASMFQVKRGELLFYALLAPIRIVEWSALLAIFFVPPWRAKGRSWSYVLAGTMWSYVLDIPAVIALFALPGGAWIC